MAVLGAVALLALPAPLSVGAATPMHAGTVDRITGVDLQNRLEIALIYGDKKAIGELLADDATISYVLDFTSALGPNSADPYLTPLFSKSEFLDSFASDQFPSFDDSRRKCVLRDSSFVVSVRGVQQYWTGSFCAGICLSSGKSANVYMTVVWTQTAAGWRVTFFEIAPLGTPWAISKSQIN